MDWRAGFREFFGLTPKETGKREAHPDRVRASLRAVRSPKDEGKHERPRYVEEQYQIKKGENLADYLVRAQEAWKQEETKEGKFNYAKAGFEAINDRRRQRDIEKHGDNWYGRMWKHLLETDRGMSILMGGRAVLGASSIAVAATMLRGDAAYFLGPALYAFGSAEYANALLRGTLYFGESRMRSFARAARRETKTVLRGLKGKERHDLSHEELVKIYDADQESLQADKKLKAKEMQNNLTAFALPKAIAAALFVHMKASVPLGWQDLDGKDLPPMEQFHRVWLSLKTGGLYYVQEFGNGIAQMGKPIWRETEEAARFMYGSAAWGMLAGILADVPEKMATATVDMGRKTLVALEKVLGRKPTQQDIEKVRAKPITGSTKKTAKFHPPTETADLEDITAKIIARAQQWLKEHPLEDEGKPVKPPLKEPVRPPLPEPTPPPPAVPKAEPEAALHIVPAKEMEQNLANKAIWNGDPALEGKEELSKTDLQKNAGLQRAHILEALGIGLSQGAPVSYREFQKALKEFVKSADKEQLRVFASFLKDHGQDLIGEEGAPVFMWVDRRHLEKEIVGKVAPSGPQAPSAPEPALPFPDLRILYEESDRKRKIAEEEAKPTDTSPKGLSWDWVLAQTQGEESAEATLEDLLAESVDRLLAAERVKGAPSKPPATDARTPSPGGFEGARSRIEARRKGPSYPAARFLLRSLLINRMDPETLAKLHRGIWKSENIPDLFTKKLAQDIERVERLSDDGLADSLLQELRVKVAPKINLKEDSEYKKVFADKVTRKDPDGGISFLKDEKGEFVYRGFDPAVIHNARAIVSRGRLNVRLTSAAIDRLDVLAKEYGFVYRVGTPTSGTSPAENKDSVTVYFPHGSSERAIEALSNFTQEEQFKRGRSDELYGKRVNSHFYLSEDFVGKVPEEETQKFLAKLQRTHKQLFEIVSEYIGERGSTLKGEITEKQFHVLKQFLASFGFPIGYSKEQGIVYLVPSRPETQKQSAA